MKYNCEYCNYSTDDFGNWGRHKKSNKHIINSNKQMKTTYNDPQKPPNDPQKPPNNFNYTCNHCNINFSKSCHLSRHLNNCKKKQEDKNKYEQLKTEFDKYRESLELEKFKRECEILREKLKLTEEQYKEKLKSTEEQYIGKLKSTEEVKEQYKEHIETLKNENKFQKQLIESAGGMIKKSMNTMSYLLLNYNTAPQLQSLPDYSTISINNETLIKDLIYYHNKGKLEKYIGDFIVKQYKKEDPKMQSVWSSDVDRLNYFIRELFKNNPELKENGKLNWINDKKGIKVKKYIIQPLLDYIENINSKYLKDKNKEISNLDTNSATNLVNDMQKIGEISCGIKNKSIAENINKYIAPHFYLSKDNEISNLNL